MTVVVPLHFAHTVADAITVNRLVLRESTVEVPVQVEVAVAVITDVVIDVVTGTPQYGGE